MPRGLLTLLGIVNSFRIGSTFLLASGLAITSRTQFCTFAHAAEAQSESRMSAETCVGERVLVTGASGRTGGLVFEKLLKREPFAQTTRGMVRNAQAVSKLAKKFGTQESSMVVADVTDPPSLANAVNGIDTVILCTSAVPKIYPFSIVKMMVMKLFRTENPPRPKFYFAEKGTPEEVDWLGAKAMIDAAKGAGVKRFVYIGSMGGTQPDNFLNTIGKKDDGSGGDILLWKRKAEKYLIASGLTYTIVHPGGLLDAEGGKRRLVLGLDDELLDRASRSVPRADVAELCVQSLSIKESENRSFDLASDPEGQGEATTDFARLIKDLSGNTDYEKGPQPPSMT